MGIIRNWRRRRILERHAIPLLAWRAVVESLPLLAGLDAAEIERLRVLATLFLYEKSLEPVQGLRLTEVMRWTVAAHAVLPILNLGIDWYDGWRSLVLYPGEFVTRHEWMDEAGLVHAQREVLSGEAWERGPMVLSWADVAAAEALDGYNPVIHECAHKLDLRNGSANGQPPLHAGMDYQEWHDVCRAAFDDLSRRAGAGRESPLDPYAAESPGEFFAVMSEHFFETPHLLKREYPEVYRQLSLFYRQDPVARLIS